MQSEGRRIHLEAEKAREEGGFDKALELSDQAMLAYQKAGDTLGFAEIEAARAITFRHLFDKTGYKGYLILAKHSAMAGI